MSLLFFTDTHIDDNPANEYRWRVFDEVRAAIAEYKIDHVYNLGDFIDRKDRFSAAFVNRLLAELEGLGKLVPFTILRGNHDTPLRGPAFFQFVNGMIDNVHYITEPTPDGRLLLLPFTPSPAEAWSGIKFSDFRAALMHVTVAGAISESGHELVGTNLPPMPRGIKLYSGDVHLPQQIKKLGLTYVGCPHPIKFGDKFSCRMLIVDSESFEIVNEWPVETIRKLVIEVRSVEELRAYDFFAKGDQARVKFNLSPDDVDKLGEIEAALSDWSSRQGVEVASTEFAVEGRGRVNDEVDTDVAPPALLRQFAAAEGLEDGLLEVGMDLLREVG